MVRNSIWVGLLFLVLITMIADAQSGKINARCKKAKEVAEGAVAFYNEHGQEKAFESFKQKEGAFRDKEVYVFIFGKEGRLIFHPTYPVLVGREDNNPTDVMGVSPSLLITAIKDKGWAHYKYLDPSDQNRIKDKHTYVVRSGPLSFASGCYGSFGEGK